MDNFPYLDVQWCVKSFKWVIKYFYRYRWRLRIDQIFSKNVVCHPLNAHRRKSIFKNVLWNDKSQSEPIFSAGLMCATAFTTISISLPSPPPSHRNFITILRFSKHSATILRAPLPFLWEKLFSVYFFTNVCGLECKKCNAKQIGWSQQKKSRTNKKINVHYVFLPKEFSSSVYNFEFKKW